MPLDPELIAILRCPRCKGALDLEPDESCFTCKLCKLRFRVQEGVPNFLLAEALPLES